MGKSFISYEFSPAERLLLLRGMHLMLSDLYEEIYFFGFYEDEDGNAENDKVLGFLSGSESEEEEEEEDSEESNFFEDPKNYEYDFESGDPTRDDKIADEKTNKFGELFDDNNDDFEDMYDDDWRVDRQQMDKLINEIKILEDKILNMDFEEEYPELDINELEILLDSAYEVKIQLEDQEEEWVDEAEDEAEGINEEIRKAMEILEADEKKQLEDDYEYLVLRQHKDLSSLIYKIREWIDNYQINSN